MTKNENTNRVVELRRNKQSDTLVWKRVLVDACKSIKKTEEQRFLKLIDKQERELIDKQERELTEVELQELCKPPEVSTLQLKLTEVELQAFPTLEQIVSDKTYEALRSELRREVRLKLENASREWSKLDRINTLGLSETERSLIIVVIAFVVTLIVVWRLG